MMDLEIRESYLRVSCDYFIRGTLEELEQQDLLG
jgi:hypothetical protein